MFLICFDYASSFIWLYLNIDYMMICLKTDILSTRATNELFNTKTGEKNVKQWIPEKCLNETH
jgi:hypothetical protein